MRGRKKHSKYCNLGMSRSRSPGRSCERDISCRSLARAENGGITLFLSAILASILAFALILHEVEALRIFQAEAEQAISAQLGADLANYHRSLHIRFGLWGVTEEGVNTQVFDQLMEQATHRLLLLPARGQAEVQTGEPLEDGERASKQIVDFMRIRAPISWFEELKSRMDQASKELSTVLREQSETLHEALDTSKEIESFLATLHEAEIPEEYQSAWEELQAQMTQAQAIGGEGQGMEQLLEGLGQVEAWLQPEAVPGLPALMVNTYVMDFFPCVTTGKEGESTTWRGGDRLANGGKDSYAVERILTGWSSGSHSLRAVQAGIVAIRTLQHVADYALHPTKRALYRPIAVLISGLIAFLSAGTLLIPPSAIEWFLVVLRSLYLGYQDMKTLCNGGEVDFQPGKLLEPKLVYRDFLRVFLLVHTRTTLAHRAILQIQECLGERFWTRVELEASFQCGIWNSGTVVRKEAFSVGTLQEENGSK